MILFVKLLLAHLIGDFLLQPQSWVADKEAKRFRSGRLYLHVLIHALLTSIVLWDINLWLPALVVMGTHYLIDLAKVLFQKASNRPAWFAVDQCLHIAVLLLIVCLWGETNLSSIHLPAEQILIITTAAILLTNPASVIIRMVISQWTPDTLYSISASLPDAGKFIGYLERLLVLVFILYNHWEAVGFLLAAKSVFRFGNLKESRDRKLTEYVLIGTLLSFGISAGVGLITSYLLGIVK